MEIRVNKDGDPILDQFSEEGFVDCVFRIANFDETGNSYNFTMLASYEDEKLEVDIQVVKGIRNGFDSEMSLIKEHVYKEGVRFLSRGFESDRLITVLSNLYGFATEPLKMISEETFTAIALHQEEIDMNKETVKIKIFGRDTEEDSEDDYYESFFNLDLKNGYVFWNEKDQGYRDPLIHALSVKRAQQNH